jgi:uncharacterized protein (TIRG00374 family)
MSGGEELRRGELLADEELRYRPQLHQRAEVAEAPEDADEEMPRVQWTRRRVLVVAVCIVVVIALLYYVLPQIAGLDETWHRIERGDPWWLALAVGFTALSFGGYVGVFRYVYAGACRRRIGMRESYQITMAGLAATRVFAAGGAGGIVLTAWALRRAGMPRREVADRSVAFLALTYAFYMAALVVCGLGLRFGVLPGPAPWGVTVVPAGLGIAAFVVCLLVALTPTDLSRRLEGFAHRRGRVARFAQRAANLPASMSAGVRMALRLARDGSPALVATAAYWGFNICVLWAAFRAFGEAPPWPVLVQGYFVGMLGNLLPLPGGVGGVDGATIGAFIAFGVDEGLAVVAVLTYRAFAFWLPTLPGAVAYIQLRKTVSRWRAEPATGYAHA